MPSASPWRRSRFVPLQVGRFAVAVLHEIATLVLPIVTFDGGFAVFQAVTAAVTVVRFALFAKSALAPASAADWVAASNALFRNEDLPDIDRQSGGTDQSCGHEAEQHDGSAFPVAQEVANSPRSGGERAFHNPCPPIELLNHLRCLCAQVQLLGA